MILGLNPSIRLIREGDHGYLYDHENGNVQIANGTALLILGFCDNTHNLKDIVNEFSTQFCDIPKSRIESDVTIFIKNLINKGVVMIL